MKKCLFISILFLLPYLAVAQGKKSIDGFMDIPFGSDSATVKAAVFAKGGIKDDALTEKDFLAFSNFLLGQKSVKNFFVKLVDNKAFDASFFFQYSDSEILVSYDNLVEDITAIYGKPASADNFPEFRSSAAKIRKIRARDIAVQTIWQSKNNTAISIKIEPVNQFLMVVLRYEDGTLFEIDAAKRRSDF